jgi:hypothetical protein
MVNNKQPYLFATLVWEPSHDYDQNQPEKISPEQEIITMAGMLYQVGATALCPHGGQVFASPGNPRVKLSGQPAATLSDVFSIAGCAFTVPGPKPQPCVLVRWLVPAARVRVGGVPAILQTSSGLCQSAEQIPQGPPNVAATQVRVRGT